MPCPLPRWTQPVRVSVTSRSVQPSLMSRQVGVHDFTFEACSGFTRVTACRFAQPPEVAFVTRLQPGPARRRPKPLVSYQTYRQLSGWDFHPLAIRAVGAHMTFPFRSRFSPRVPLFSVESRMGAVAAHASPRLPSPLIEPDVRISRIRLSDRVHRQTHGGAARCTWRNRNTPSEPKSTSFARGRVPRVGT